MSERGPDEPIEPSEPTIKSEVGAGARFKIVATEQEIKAWPLSEEAMVQTLRQKLLGLASPTEAQPVIAGWLKEAEDRNDRVYESIISQVPTTGLSAEGNQITVDYLQKQLKQQAELLQTVATNVWQEYKASQTIVEQPASSGVLVVDEVSPETKAEWVDDTGIKFSRELTAEEMKAKDLIDDEAMVMLSIKAKVRLQEERFSNFNSDQQTNFVDQYVADGLCHVSMVQARKKLYSELELPVVE